MKYKGVEGGTKSGEVLCRTCIYSKIMIGKAEGQQEMICTYGSDYSKIPFEVIECSKYDDMRKTSIFELYKIAWVIQPDGPKNKIGFSKPGSDEHRKLLMEI